MKIRKMPKTEKINLISFLRPKSKKQAKTFALFLSKQNKRFGDSCF